MRIRCPHAPTFSHRPRAGVLHWSAVGAVLAVQGAAIALAPTSWLCLAISATWTIVTLAVFVAIVRRLARRTGQPEPPRPPATTGNTITQSHQPSARHEDAERTEYKPSAHIALAYELALRGVPTARIASECNIPPAMAEVIVLEACARSRLFRHH